MLALILAPVVQTYAQDALSLEGTVRDATGAAVADARVIVGSAGGERVGTTDTAGRYRIDGLSPGRYSVRAERAGFTPATATAELSASATPGTTDLVLTTVVAAESVTVSGVAPGPTLDNTTEAASRLGLTARETPAIVNVITFDEVQGRGLRTTVEALNSVPGVASALPPGSIGSMAIRGFTGGAVSLLYDGTRVTTSNMVSRDFDSWSFERIEVLKGPASVLYGEGALAGAVNLVSKRPDFLRQRASVLVSYGSLNTSRIAAEATGPLGSRAAYRVDVVGSNTDGHVDSQFSTFAVTGGVDVKLARGATLGVSVEHFRDDYDVSYWGTPLVPAANARRPSDIVSDSRGFVLDEAMRAINYNVADGLTDAQSTWLRGKLQWPLSPTWRLSNEAYAYDSLRRWHNAEVYGFTPATGQLSRSTVFIEHDHQFYGNRLTISADGRVAGRRSRFVAGFDGNRNDFFNPRKFGATTNVDPFNPTPGTFPVDDSAASFPGAGNRTNFDTTVTQASAFVEEALSLAPRLTVVAGGRVDRLQIDRGVEDLNAGTTSTFEKSFTPGSWRAGVVVDATARTQLFGQYTSAVAPVATVLLISQASLDFKLSTGGSWEGGIKSTLAGGRLDATASVFTITQDDILTRDPNNANITIQGGSQASTGTELTIGADLTARWRLDANATLMDVRFETLLEAGGLDRAGNVPPNAPERLAGFWTSYRLPGVPLTLAGGARYHGAFFTNNANSTRVSGFTLVDAQATWRLRSGDITIRGKNLTDTLYADWTGASASQVMLGRPRTVDVAYHVRF